MLVAKLVQISVFGLAMLWDSKCEAASTSVKLCGRALGDIMSRVCHEYNSPPWDVPTVVEQPVVRRRRRTGIADECCVFGCTFEQLTSYCAISVKSDSSLDSMEAHMIADRSAETEAGAAASPALVGKEWASGETGSSRREVGRGRSRGYGRARARGRRCWCRRKRRSGRRRSSLMGNLIKPKTSARHLFYNENGKPKTKPAPETKRGAHKKCRTRCARTGNGVAPADLGQNPQH